MCIASRCSVWRGLMCDLAFNRRVANTLVWFVFSGLTALVAIVVWLLW